MAMFPVAAANFLKRWLSALVLHGIVEQCGHRLVLHFQSGGHFLRISPRRRGIYLANTYLLSGAKDGNRRSFISLCFRRCARICQHAQFVQESRAATESIGGAFLETD